MTVRYHSRSINARPAGLAWARNTPSWQFSTRPAVPVYWRWTPTVWVPYDERAVMPALAAALLRAAGIRWFGCGITRGVA